MAFGQGDGSIILSTKVDTSGIKSGMGSIQGMVGKIGVALAAAFSVKKVYDFVKALTDAYSEFEQLEGGVKKIFDQADMSQIMEDAQNAFFDLGLSLNAYLRKINDVGATFSATMGDQKGYDTARKGLLAISDYASGTGKSVDVLSEKFTMITRSASSYQSIADQFSGILPATSKDFLKQAKAAGILSDQYAELTQVPIAEYQAAVTEMLSKGVKELGLTGNTAAEAASTISGSAAMMEAAWENTLVAISSGEGIDRAVNNLVYSIQKYFENIVPVVQRSLIGIGQLVEGIAPLLVQTVAQSLIDAMPYLVSAVYQMLIGIAKGIYQGIIDLISGAVNDTLEVQAESISASVDNQNALTEAVEGTNKELKKSLAGFDDLQILSSGASEAADSAADSAAVSAAGVTAVSTPSASPTINNETTSKITDELATLMTLVGVALVAIGLILLFTGNIPMGIGFIIAGATTLTVTMATASEFGYDGIIKMLTTIMGIAGGALLALGIILLWIGGIVGKPVAIGMIIAGGALIVSAVAAKAAFSPDDVGGWLTLIMGIAAGALLALGIILCMVGSTPLGIGMIIAGSVALVSAVALNFDVVKDQIKGWVAVIMGIVGAAALVIGIILCVTGVGIPIGIALIAAGAVSLATPIALNWNTIVDWVKGAWEATKQWIATYGGLVLGILLLFTGVGAPLGMALIMDSVSSLGKGEKPVLWSSILDSIKKTWSDIKAYWNANIANVWTLKFWLDLAKIAGNGLISGFELAINGIIGMFEKMINWIVDGINSISFDVPDWVPGIGGDTFGFNIPEVSFGRVSIPRLAKGAVIPANREFLAVLGDQRQGVNIETPLETMIEAFQMALDSRGGTSTTEVVLEIDGREFGRAVVEQGNKENRRIGTRLVIA